MGFSGKRKKIRAGKKKFWSSSKILSLFFLILIVLISFPLVEKIKQREKVDSEIEKLRNEMSQLERENRELDKLIEYLKSDQFLEEQARLNLGLKRKGEEVLVIKEEEEKRVAGASMRNSDLNNKDPESTSPSSNPVKWWRYFFN